MGFEPPSCTNDIVTNLGRQRPWTVHSKFPFGVCHTTLRWCDQDVISSRVSILAVSDSDAYGSAISYIAKAKTKLQSDKYLLGAKNEWTSKGVGKFKMKDFRKKSCVVKKTVQVIKSTHICSLKFQASESPAHLFNCPWSGNLPVGQKLLKKSIG